MAPPTTELSGRNGHILDTHNTDTMDYESQNAQISTKDQAGSNQEVTQNMPGTPTSEVTLVYPTASRTTSIVSAATSQASNTHLLSGRAGLSNGTNHRTVDMNEQLNGNSQGLTEFYVFKSSQRKIPDDYYCPVLKEYVVRSGHRTGIVLDAIQRKEMCAYHRWRPATDVGVALMECRDSDALQGVRTAKKVGSWISRRSEAVITDLHLAAAFGVVEVVDALLEFTNMQSVNNGDLLRKVPFAPHQPIDYAAAGDHVEVIASLIKAGSSVDSASVTPLCFAVQKKAYGAIDLLLEYGSDPLAVCDYGSPLHRASKANDSLIVTALSDHISTPKPCIISFQILHPLPISHPSYFGLGHTALLHVKVDPLAWAVFNGSLEAATILLARGASPDIEYHAEFVSGGKRVTHVTALSLAAAKGLDRLVRLLLTYQPSAKAKDHAFAAAIYNKEHESARLVADAGARSTFVTKAWGKLLGVDGAMGSSASVASEAQVRV